MEQQHVRCTRVIRTHDVHMTCTWVQVSMFEAFSVKGCYEIRKQDAIYMYVFIVTKLESIQTDGQTDKTTCTYRTVHSGAKQA